MSCHSSGLIVLKMISLPVNSVIKLFVNWRNCFNNRRTEARQLQFLILLGCSLSLPVFFSVIDRPLHYVIFKLRLCVCVRVCACVGACVGFLCRDAKCGKIQCQGGANRPVIGTNAVSIETNIPLQEGGRILCRGTHVYLGDDMPDPGLVLAGTKCGDGTVSNTTECVVVLIFF